MRRRRRRAALGLLAAVTALAVGFFLLDAQVRPLVQAYGQMSARRSAMLAVHTGVERALAQDETSYRRLILLERDAEGRVLSAETDVAAVNRLKAAASNAVMAELAARERQTVRLPLGNLIGGSFWTGLLILMNASDSFIGSMSMISTAANMLQLFAPILLERFEHRKKLLLPHNPQTCFRFYPEKSSAILPFSKAV